MGITGFIRQAAADITFQHKEEDTGGHKWPTRVRLAAVHPDTGEEMGFLTYRVPRRKADKIAIDRLETHSDHQRKGIGSALMDEMQRRHPGTPIDHGDRTPDGKSWWKGYTDGKKVRNGRTLASATNFFRQAVTDGYTAATDDRGSHGAHRSGSRDGQRGPGRRAAAPQQDRHLPQGQRERAAVPRRQAAQDREVVRHPDLQGDLDSLGGGAKHVVSTIEGLRRGEKGITTYPLSHPLEGWHAAITNGGHQVVHRHDADTGALHVGYAGFNTSDAEERLGQASGGTSLPVHFHNEAEKEFDRLDAKKQDKALDTIDRLSRNEAHPDDHLLQGPIGTGGGRWRSARIDFLHRVVHRYEDHQGNPVPAEQADRLHVGFIGPHNYETANRRLSSATAFFRQAAKINIDTAQGRHPGVHPEDWFHGTSHRFTHFEDPASSSPWLHDPYDEPANDDDYGDDPDEDEHSHLSGTGHWNTRLGNHFTADHGVAKEFAGEHGRIIHARLHLKNPKKYFSEYDMDHEVHTDEHGRGNYITPHLASDEDYDDLAPHERDAEAELHRGDDQRGPYNQAWQFGRNRPMATSWVNSHPDREAMADRFKQKLIDQGHDGILYRNEIEKGKGSRWTAIAFHPHQIEITHIHRPDQEHHDPQAMEDFHKHYPGHGQESLFEAKRHTAASPDDYARRDGEDWSDHQQRLQRGMSLGHLTYRQARSHGYSGFGSDEDPDAEGSHGGWQPLPHTLYHTTTDLQGVRNSGGLKTGAELGQRKGHGLGGTPEWLSLTDSPEHAHRMLDALHEYHGLVTGKTTLHDLHAAAQRGDGAEHPFHEEFIRDYLGPEHFDRAANRLNRWTGEPATDSQHHEALSTAYDRFAWARQHAGGPPRILFSRNDSEAFAKKDPSNFGILTVRPKPGAQGFPKRGEHEWRTATGDAVEIHGEPQRHTAAAHPGPGPQEYAKREGEDHFDWHDRVRRGLSLGHLTHEQAAAHNYSGGGHEHNGWQPLPPTLYHTTTDVAGVMAHGLKAGHELGQDKGHGLGGTPDYLSMTDSAEHAHTMLHALHEYHDHLTGKTTFADLHRAAEKGEGAQQPYHEEFLSTAGSGDNEYARHSRMRDKRLEPGFATYDEAREKGWTPHPTVHRAFTAPDGTKIGTGWERDATLYERHSDYGAFSRARERTGHGTPSVLFLSNDREAFAKKDPSNFGVLKLRPKPGAQGHYLPGEHEWRTGTGDAVEVHGEPLRRTEARIGQVVRPFEPAASCSPDDLICVYPHHTGLTVMAVDFSDMPKHADELGPLSWTQLRQYGAEDRARIHLPEHRISSQEEAQELANKVTDASHVRRVTVHHDPSFSNYSFQTIRDGDSHIVLGAGGMNRMTLLHELAHHVDRMRGTYEPEEVHGDIFHEHLNTLLRRHHPQGQMAEWAHRDAFHSTDRWMRGGGEARLYQKEPNPEMTEAERARPEPERPKPLWGTERRHAEVEELASHAIENGDHYLKHTGGTYPRLDAARGPIAEQVEARTADINLSQGVAASLLKPSHLQNWVKYHPDLEGIKQRWAEHLGHDNYPQMRREIYQPEYGPRSPWEPPRTTPPPPPWHGADPHTVMTREHEAGNHYAKYPGHDTDDLDYDAPEEHWRPHWEAIGTDGLLKDGYVQPHQISHEDAAEWLRYHPDRAGIEQRHNGKTASLRRTAAVEDGDEIPSRLLNPHGHHIRARVGGYTNVEMVPRHEIERYASQPTELAHAKEVGYHIATTGQMEPLILHYHPANGEAYLGEGNHRLRAARLLQMDHLPLRVERASYGLGGTGVPTPQRHPAQETGGHVPGEIKPSDLGIGTGGTPRTAAQASAEDFACLTQPGLSDPERPRIKATRDPWTANVYAAQKAMTASGQDLQRYGSLKEAGQAAQQVLRDHNHPQAEQLLVHENSVQPNHSWVVREDELGEPDEQFRLHLGTNHFHNHAVLHEMAHFLAGDGGHGPHFVKTFRSLLQEHGHHRALKTFDEHFKAPQEPHTAAQASEHIGEAEYEEDDGYHRGLWDQWHPKLPPEIHRHLSLPLSGDHPAHNPKLPAAERAHAILDSTKTKYQAGLGMHWTSDEGYNHMGSGRLMPGDTHVIVHAKTPPREHIEDNDWVLEDRAIRDWDMDPEKEVPVKHNAPMSITGVSWKGVDGWQHHRFDEPVTKQAATDTPVPDNHAPYQHHHDWLPHGHFFGPGKKGLDPRLFDGTRMRPEIRQQILGLLDHFWRPKYGGDWQSWARVYLTGSEASHWYGNNDLDTLIGVDYDLARQMAPKLRGLSNHEIDTHLTDELRTGLNDDHRTLDSDGHKTGPFESTFYVNENSFDIRRLKPYAAYDITNDRWAVTPVQVPADFDAHHLPERDWDDLDTLRSRIEEIATLPKAERERQGAALYDELHADRHDAFSPDGTGLYDERNVVWKALDAAPGHPLQQLTEWKKAHDGGASDTQEAA